MLWQLVDIRDVATGRDRTDSLAYRLLGNIYEVVMHEGRMVLIQYGQWILRTSPVRYVEFDPTEAYCIYTTANSEYHFLLANTL